MALVGAFRYVQANDPGDVGAGFEWWDTVTGQRWVRNLANTAWVSDGNVGLVNSGNVPITGGTMTGPLEGATGLAPLVSPDFQNALKLEGRDVALISNLNTAIRNSEIRMTSKVQEIVTRSINSPVRSNIAFEINVVTNLVGNSEFTIALPRFNDESSTEATIEQVVDYGCAFKRIVFYDHEFVGMEKRIEISQVSGRTYKILATDPGSTGTDTFEVTTFILATR